MNKPKILYFDIESSPLLGYTWGKYDQNVMSFERDWNIMSVAYKWAGDKTVKCIALPDFKDYKKDKHNDLRLVEKLWDLFDEADILVAHNGDRFDIRKSNARFLAHGLNPPSPYQTIDTLKMARKYFAMTSNKLDDICKTLGIGRKESTGGFKLWEDCIAGDKKAWGIMRTYNKQDVNLLEKVYLRLRTWSTNHPNMGLYGGHSHACPVCASKDLQKRGFRRTRVGIRQAYQCKCGAWSQGELQVTNTVTR